MLSTHANNLDFVMCSTDITGAVLQGKDIDRDVFVKPPKDILEKNLGKLLKLKKSLYGLNDTSRNSTIGGRFCSRLTVL